MRNRIPFFSISMLFISFGFLCQAEAAKYVIIVSVDGGGSQYIQDLINRNQLPNFNRFQTEGTWTNNARSDYDVTVTLPNHISEMTSRGIYGYVGNGHLWTHNSDPAPGQTLHSNKGSYVFSIFDVAHDNGKRTAVYATKTKFKLFDVSYDPNNGALDTTGVDNGRDKLDFYQCFSDSASLIRRFSADMSENPYNCCLIHLADGDSAGHSSGWGSNDYNNALIAVDNYLGLMFSFIRDNPALKNETVIILTADHGGHEMDHADAADPLNYTIPFYVWGTGVQAGADLYQLNVTRRMDPGTGRPSYTEAISPIRNSEVGNLGLDLLQLGPIPGSTVNFKQDLNLIKSCKPLVSDK